MPSDQRAQLQAVRTFAQLVRYLRDELGWPIGGDAFEDMVFEYTPEELGINSAHAAAIQEIKRLRPLVPNQPWGIFFVKFEPKRLPVVALRRILSQVVIKKRATAKAAELAAWQMSDLLFISNYGAGADERRISLAYFSQSDTSGDLPMLKVLGWDGADTNLHLDNVAEELHGKLHWPADAADVAGWRRTWAAAFTVQHGEVISTSKRLAVRLAELARGIRAKALAALAIESEAGPLRSLLRSFRDALIHDLDEEGFADMYAQTISYGLLTARISRPQGLIADNLADMVPVTNPFLKEMLETFVRMGGRRKAGRGSTGIDFDELGVNDVVQLLRAANMEAVVRDFGDKNPQEDPVIHFYELFLKEYDAKKRMQRGVFYTPQPVVSYIVRSVHDLLQTEFSLEDGLADTTTWGEMLKTHPGLKLPPLTDEPGEKRTISPDEPFVQILDPATGTATFLVEVIDVIHRTLMAKWKQQRLSDAQQLAAWNDYVPKYLLPRLHAFELMMAPYAIAHMKIGLKLAETGYRFGTEERARIYLTNALEPWVKQLPLIGFDALADEAASVNEIKRHKRFTVVIGNPPYSGVSSNMSEYAQRIVDAYKFVDGGALNERKLWLQDDYVKFIRKAQTTIESAYVGILGFITNHGYLDNPTFRGMRQSLMGTFPRFHVLDLHGNTTKIERPPDDIADKNVFDIKQGVAICLATRGDADAAIAHAELWGIRETKYAWLAKHDVASTGFSPLTPDSPYYFLSPQNNVCRAEYDGGWKINEVMPVNCAGFITARDHFVVDVDQGRLLERIGDFRSAKFSDAEIRTAYFDGCGSAKYPDGDTRGWKLPMARKRVSGDKHWSERVRPCLYRPFDVRSVYWADWMVDWPRPDLEPHFEVRNQTAFCITRFNRQQSLGYFFISRSMADFHALDTAGDSMSVFPWQVAATDGLALETGGSRFNLAPKFVEVFAAALGVGITAHGLPTGLTPEDIFHYAYAVFHSPGYRSRYAEFLKIDFPRLPLTGNLELFRALARLGGELTALHLLESPKLGQPITEFMGGRNPEVEKISWSRNTVWVDKAQTSGFKGVPEAVWNFHIGGYQVCEKWLKDRKGRTLSKDDIAHYQKIVVALNETIRLMQAIDVVIEQHGGWPGAFAQPAGSAHTGSDGPAPVPVFGGARKLNLDAAAPAALQLPDESAEETPAVGASVLDGAGLMCAVRQLFTKGVALERTAAVSALAQALGVSAADAGIAAELDGALRTAVRRGILENTRGQLQIDVRTIAAYQRDFLKDQFLAALPGRQWVERDAAMRRFARWLGFKRTGKAIDDSVRSVINGLLREGRLESTGTQIRRGA